jgi:hypothetical protein
MPIKIYSIEKYRCWWNMNALQRKIGTLIFSHWLKDIIWFHSCSSNTILERELDLASRLSLYVILQMDISSISRYIQDKVRIFSIYLWFWQCVWIYGTDLWANNFSDVQSLSVSEKIVVHLAGHLLQKNYCLYADNRFVSARLARWLREHDITITGTIKKNRGDKIISIWI